MFEQVVVMLREKLFHFRHGQGLKKSQKQDAFQNM